MRFIFLVLCLSTFLYAKKEIGITITSDPLGAEIYEDDSLLGTTPLTIKEEKNTVHQFTAVKDGFLDTSWTATSGNLNFSKEHILLRVDLTKDEIAQKNSGMANLEVLVDRPGVEVFVDGTPYDRSLDKVIQLKPGKHYVNIKGQDIEHYLDTVELVPGERVRLIAQTKLKDFFSVGAYYVRDFARFDFENFEAQLGGQLYTINHEEDPAGMREFSISLGNFKEKKSSGFIMMIHAPRTDTFATPSEDLSDTLHMITTVWGAGMFRDYFWTLFRFGEYFQFDIGVMWGAYAKVRQYKYYSNSGSGGIGDLNLENRNGESVAPFRAYGSLGGPQMRVLAGHKNVKFSLSYHFHPSVEFDGLHQFPNEMFFYRSIHRLNIGITTKF